MSAPHPDRYPRLHRDGTVSYWSYDRGEWVQRALFVPLHELERLTAHDRRRVRRHLGEPDPEGDADHAARA